MSVKMEESFGVKFSKPERNAGGEIIGYHGITREITARKSNAGQSARVSILRCTYQITQSSLLKERLNYVLAEMKRSHQYSALLLDLDNFKALNDTWS